MTSFAAQCIAILFTGIISHHHATCCVAFGAIEPTPPGVPVPLFVVGECRVPHFHHRQSIQGDDLGNGTTLGPLTLMLCRARGDDCCTLTAPPLPPTFLDAPTPLTGTVQCPTKHGMQMGTFTLKPKGTK